MHLNILSLQYKLNRLSGLIDKSKAKHHTLHPVQRH